MLISAVPDHSASFSVVSISNRKIYQISASGYVGINVILGLTVQTNVQGYALKTVSKTLLLENTENFYQTSSIILIIEPKVGENF